MKKRIAAFVLVIGVLISLSTAFAATPDTDVIPRGMIHCQSGSKVGQLIESHLTKQIGKETRGCPDVQGATDIRYQYGDYDIYVCSLCTYRSETQARKYWGDWQHSH